jgi:hypothetical protein
MQRPSIGLHAAGKIGETLIKKRKIGRPPSENPMVHTALVLPTDLLVRLKRDAAASDQAVSAVIRQRLQTSFEREGPDPETSGLVECIKDLADSLARDLGVPWHRTDFGRKAMKDGVEIFLGEYDAEGGKLPDTPFTGYPDDAPPKVVGQTHARLILRARHGGDKKR